MPIEKEETMKKAATILVMTLLSLCLHAQDGAQLLIVYKDGSETLLSLSARPVVSFEGDTMVVESEEAHLSMPIDDVGFYKVVDPEGIRESLVVPAFTAGHVVFTGLPKGTKAIVFTIDGKVAGSQRADDLGQVDVDMGRFAKGTYLVKAGMHSIKVTRK